MIDGEQNLADILTKLKVDKALLMACMRTRMPSLVQTEANRELKEKKRAQRQARKKVVKSDEKKQKEKDERIRRVVAEMQQRPHSDSDLGPRENKECENLFGCIAFAVYSVAVASSRPRAKRTRTCPLCIACLQG